jgi:hypothetical protein
MARWIDASPAQRLHQYLIPAARREIAEAPAMFAEYKTMIARAWANRYKQEAASYGRRSANRYIKRLISEVRSHEASVERSRALVDKHSKRK